MIRSITLSAVLLCTSAAISADDGGVPPHAIVISVGDGPLATGQQVPVKISYRNQGEAGWTLNQPDQSTTDALWYERTKPAKHLQGERFAHVKVVSYTDERGRDVTAWGSAPYKPITIEPGKSFDFEVLWPSKWSTEVMPAIYTLWVGHPDGELESNRIRVPVWFTDESAAACLVVAGDKTQDL